MFFSGLSAFAHTCAHTPHTPRKVTQSAPSSTTIIIPSCYNKNLSCIKGQRFICKSSRVHVQMGKAIKLEVKDLRIGSVAFLHSPLFYASPVKPPKWEIKTIGGTLHWESLKLNIENKKRVLSRVKIGATIRAKVFTCFSVLLLPPNRGGKKYHINNLYILSFRKKASCFQGQVQLPSSLP